VARQTIWRTKLAVLLTAAGLVLFAFLVSCEWRLHLPYAKTSPASVVSDWAIGGPRWARSHFDFLMEASGVMTLVAVAGGLWTALLFRQVATAFWITLLMPAGLLTSIAFFLPENMSELEMTVLFFWVAAIYVGTGFWLARRLFYRAQDVAWTGGPVSLSKWRYFEGTRPVASVRRRKPLTALVKKEFQLHSISLFGAGALLALHIGVLFLRMWYVPHHRLSMVEGLSDFFWMAWLVLPLAMGCMAVAEERKLGVTEAESCQPVSRRWRFLIKFVPVIVLGTFLGGVLPVGFELFAMHHGAPSSFFRSADTEISQTLVAMEVNQFTLFKASIIGIAFAFSLIAFYASTLARNFLQAMSVTIVIIVFLCLAGPLVTWLGMDHRSIFAVIGPPLLLLILAVPVTTATYLRLAYRNIDDFRATAWLWWRNLLGIAVAVAAVIGVSTALYHRAWEVFARAEPAHGPAKLSRSAPPTIDGHLFYDNCTLRMPDGRIELISLEPRPWFRKIPSRLTVLGYFVLQPLPTAGPRHFIEGTNWISVAASHVDFWFPRNGALIRAVGYLDTVGVKQDGTLWFSPVNQKAWNGTNLVQFGHDADWREVSRSGSRTLLLKSDGTLWSWGAEHWNGFTNIPSVKDFEPRQVGTNSDWKELSPFLRKTDGTVWYIGSKDGKEEWFHPTNLDQTVSATVSSWGSFVAYVGKDGSLWARTTSRADVPFYPLSPETNWVAVSASWNQFVALKSDGTLWRWKVDYGSDASPFTEGVILQPPARLSVHDDWIAVVSMSGTAVSLAADGGLWVWPNPTDHGRQVPIIKPSTHPKYLGNIFDETD